MSTALPGVSPAAGPVASGAVDSAERHALLVPEATRRREIVWQDPLASLARGAGLTGLDYWRSIASGEIPPPPIAVLMRMSVALVAEGRVAFDGEPSEEHYNPIGVVHGGYAATLLDSALGSAVHTMLPAGTAYTTQTLELKLVRPISRDTGRVRAEGVVEHLGRRQATASARLTAIESGKLLAHATSTCMIVDP